MRTGTGTTFRDHHGFWFVVVPTRGDEGAGHWAGPFAERMEAVDFCPIFGAEVEAPEVPDVNARRYDGGVY